MHFSVGNMIPFGGMSVLSIAKLVSSSVCDLGFVASPNIALPSFYLGV